MRLFFQALAFIQFHLLFLLQVLISGMEVLYWIYRKPRELESNFVHYQLNVTKNWQRLMIAHFVTLTPGSLSVDLSESGELLVHLLRHQDAEENRKLIYQRLEPLVKKIAGEP